MRKSLLSLFFVTATQCTHASTEENIASIPGITAEETVAIITTPTPTTFPAAYEEEIFIQTTGPSSSEVYDGVARCSESDFDLWRGNMEFTLAYSDISFNGLGLEMVVGPALRQRYPSLSETCLPCFTTATACGRDRCGLDCLFNRFGQRCLDCNAEHCTPAFRRCIGAKSDWDMPPQPEVNDAPSTTIAPKKVRTRKQAPASASTMQETTTETTTASATKEESIPSKGKAAFWPGVAAAATILVAFLAWVYANLYR